MASLVSVKRENWVAVVSYERLVGRLASGRFTEELFRGVVDAGRRTKTKVQKAVRHQMAVNGGYYQSYVVRNTRGIPRRGILAYDIFGVKGGIEIEAYKGLRVLGRRAPTRRTGAEAIFERGVVKSGVWNHPRVFKRSFELGKGDLRAMIPGGSGRAPKVLWTYGYKPNQPRGAMGRFASSGKKYGKMRKLFGPALLKEIPQGESMATFFNVGPMLLEEKVGGRLAKLLQF